MGLQQSRKVEIYRTQKDILVNAIRPSGFANSHLLKLGSYPPAETGRRGPVFRCLIEQTINPFSRLDLSKQIGM